MIVSESPVHSRPYVVDFKTGFSAAVLAVINGWKDGYTDLLNTPRIAHERHGHLGSIAGTFIGLTNGIFKPLVGTLSSLTWLYRGLYGNINNESLIDRGTEACTVNTLGLDPSFSPLTNEEQAIQIASTLTDFSPEICREILSQFDQIKCATNCL